MKYKMSYTSPNAEKPVVKSYKTMSDAHIDVIDMLAFTILSSYVVQNEDVANVMYHVMQDKLVSLFETADEDDQEILNHIYSNYNDMPFSSILNLYLRFTIIDGRKNTQELAPGFILQTSYTECRFKIDDVGVYEFLIDEDPESDIRDKLLELTRKYGSSLVRDALDDIAGPIIGRK